MVFGWLGKLVIVMVKVIVGGGIKRKKMFLMCGS